MQAVLTHRARLMSNLIVTGRSTETTKRQLLPLPAVPTLHRLTPHEQKDAKRPFEEGKSFISKFILACEERLHEVYQ